MVVLNIEDCNDFPLVCNGFYNFIILPLVCYQE